MSLPSGRLLEPTSADVRWHFGSFTLWETRRRLERAGRDLKLGPRSFDLLLHLVKRAGDFVGKDELLSVVWAGLVVEEGSVRVHISTLRKALGEPGDADGCSEWITNVPLRGYRFNGHVRRELGGASTAVKPRPLVPSLAKPPVRVAQLIGREADVEAVLASLSTHRLITIAGSGGIGKTSVAISAAERHQALGMELAFVDLAPLISPDHVLGTIARSVGAAADMPDAVHAVGQTLAGRKVLLLVDNCEHVIDALAEPITGLLAALPNLRILATSREVLRLPGECVVRLSPLAVPHEERIPLAEALRSPAVELLVERARAAGAGVFNESQAPALAKIARRLDGIPLAIELVAARLGVQSVTDLASRLDDHLRLHSAGTRAALPRHKTLSATLEWSITLLNEEELRLFRRLSVFRGLFDAESALSVAADADTDAALDALISLTNKSLVVFDANNVAAPYRLLDTTRSYGSMLLERTGERAALLHRHALFMLDLMKAATAEIPRLSEQAWDERFAYRLDDVRLALEGCVSGQPDAKMAVALISASGPLWFNVSQVEEYRDWIRATLALVDEQDEPNPEATATLNTVLISALLQTGGSPADLDLACERALEGALAVQAKGLELRARWGRCTHDMFRGEYTSGLRNAEALSDAVQSWTDLSAHVLSHRVSAMANHFCGRLEVSRQHSDAAIALVAAAGRSTDTTMVGPDAIIAAKTLLCRTLWLQGETAKALETANDTAARAEATGNSVSLCSGLFGPCVVALWAGEIELARRWIPLMTEEARRRGLLGWLRFAEWYAEGLQLHSARDAEQHVRDVSLRLRHYEAPRKEMLLTFCVDWLDDELVSRVERGEGLWCAAEVWRALGWRHERRGVAGDAEILYRRAIDVARSQGAAAWELRAALNLADLWEKQGRRVEGALLLDETARRAPTDSENDGLTQVRRLRARLDYR